MKTKLSILAFYCLIVSSCAPYQVISFDQAYIKVFEDLPGNKNQLFVKANEWMVKTFNSAESVIQFSDKEEGTIIGKYLMFGEVHSGGYGVTVDNRVYAKIDIRIKDNKARISIEPLDKWQYDPSGISIYKLSRESALDEMDGLSDGLHKALIAKTIDF
jgi:hypothetical protein